VSDVDPWVPLIGQTIDAVDARIGGGEAIAEESATFRIGERWIKVAVVADELHASVTDG
jgi:hypothetical protein